MSTKTTPAAEWREKGESDPHAGHYEGPREKLTLGHMSDDALANGAFMNYDQPLDIARMLAEDKDYFAPIVWMTAVKDRIRWLSRALVKSEAKLSNPDDTLLAEISAQFFAQRGVPNFIEITFDDVEHGSMSLTIQKTSGKTPGELHDDIKHHLAETYGALIAAQDALAHCRADIGYSSKQTAAAIAINAVLAKYKEKSCQ